MIALSPENFTKDVMQACLSKIEALSFMPKSNTNQHAAHELKKTEDANLLGSIIGNIPSFTKTLQNMTTMTR